MDGNPYVRTTWPNIGAQSEKFDLLLAAAVEKYAKTQSKLAAWMAENIPEGLAVQSEINKEWGDGKIYLNTEGNDG